ncbi:MAG: hypothetical protein CMA64_07535 [Euryarchaeota archaeon]|nr:hypothetical protein [Euryarchaeota archaeon]
MTTTFVRLKNRRGNRTDLPQPLAEGELGLALDTRELYIGAGEQSSKNRMVQVGNFINAQSSVQSLIDTRLVVFKMASTESFKGDGTNTSSTTLNGSVLTFPTGKDSASFGSDKLEIYKYNINKIPSKVSTAGYSVSVAGSDLTINFNSSGTPENNSVICVTKWLGPEIVEYVKKAYADEMSIATSAVTAAVSKTEDVITFSATGKTTYTLYTDVSSGTGFVDIGDHGANQLTKQNSFATELAAENGIGSAGINTAVFIRGTMSDLGYTAAKVSVPGSLLIELDSPQQAVLLSKFLNTALGTAEASVANNIKVYTQDSKPEFLNNQYVGPTFLIKKTLTKGGATADVTSFSATETNTYFLDYSLKFGSAYAVGCIRIISDGTNVHYIDDRTETASTNDIVFSTPAVSGGVIKLQYTNSSSSTDATLSYVLKRWLTS